MEMKADIIDYMGKCGDGVLVLLSVSYNQKYYDGMFFYTKQKFTITVDDELEKEIGCSIENWEGYKDFSLSILKKVVPYSEIVVRIDDIDFDKLFSVKENLTEVPREVDYSQIVLATSSNIN
jgi:hypothetical protein